VQLLKNVSFDDVNFNEERMVKLSRSMKQWLLKKWKSNHGHIIY